MILSFKLDYVLTHLPLMSMSVQIMEIYTIADVT